MKSVIAYLGWWLLLVVVISATSHARVDPGNPAAFSAVVVSVSLALIWSLGSMFTYGTTRKVAEPKIPFVFVSVCAGLLVVGDLNSLNQGHPFVEEREKAVESAASSAWSGNTFDRFDSVEQIKEKALRHSELRDEKVWEVVLEWQRAIKTADGLEENEALYKAVENVLRDVRGGKLCHPGKIFPVSRENATTELPEGSLMIMVECE